MNIIHNVLPPFAYRSILAMYRKVNKKKFLYWDGDYSGWQEAAKQCKGYSESIVLDKVKSSALKVKNGEAAFERDGVLFYNQEYSWELLASLLKVAAEFKGKLSVLDFGGSLGSTYFQNKKMLEYSDVSWCIVEQDNFVSSGKSLFEDKVLKFEYSIEEAISKYNPNVLVLGSVLQYLPDPYEWLQKFSAKKFPYIIIERTPFIKAGNDRLTVQHVPAEIYSASYPSWFFSEQKFLQFITKNYSVLASYTSNDRANINSEFKGFFLKLN